MTKFFFLSLQASTASKKYKFVVTGHSKYQRREEDLTQSGEFLYTKLFFCLFIFLKDFFLNEGFNKLTQEANENIQFYSLVVYNFGNNQFLYNIGFLLSVKSF